MTLAILPQAARSAEVETTLDITEPFRPGVSLLWCPAGQASWDALRAYHGVQTIEMNPRSITAEKLNAFQWDKNQVLPAGTQIFAGDDSEAFRQRIRDTLRKSIGENAAAMIGPYQGPGPTGRIDPNNGNRIIRLKSALIVSAISCKPRFPSDFMPDPSPKLFFDRSGKQHKALGFGSSAKMSATYGDAVRVLEDDLAGSVSVRLGFFSGDPNSHECLVLTTGQNPKNFESTLTHVRDLLRKERVPEKVIEHGGKKWRYTDTLNSDDVIWVPHLKATVSCSYPDLIGKRYLEDKKAMTWWEIREATQLLNVGLDHKGAMVQAVFKVAPDFLTSGGEGTRGGPLPAAPLPLYPKSFVFDKPFLASLWRDGADWPYMAFWVDGAEMLAVAK